MHALSMPEFAMSAVDFTKFGLVISLYSSRTTKCFCDVCRFFLENFLNWYSYGGKEVHAGYFMNSMFKPRYLDVMSSSAS